VVQELPPSAPIGAEVDPAHLALVREGLIAVVEGTPGTPATAYTPATPRVHGTGGRARVPGLSVAGKTGTSQVVRLDVVKDLEDDEIPIRYRDHALFAAFAPAENPEIAIAVVIEHAGKGGGAVAAPIAQKVIARWFEKRQEREAPEPESVVARADGGGAAAETSQAGGGG
jgi:penicillin-binding protein 2